MNRLPEWYWPPFFKTAAEDSPPKRSLSDPGQGIRSLVNHSLPFTSMYKRRWSSATTILPMNGSPQPEMQPDFFRSNDVRRACGRIHQTVRFHCAYGSAKRKYKFACPLCGLFARHSVNLIPRLVGVLLHPATHSDSLLVKCYTVCRSQNKSKTYQ